MAGTGADLPRTGSPAVVPRRAPRWLGEPQNYSSGKEALTAEVGGHV